MKTKIFVFILLACSAMLGSILMWPVDFMEIRTKDAQILAMPLYSGQVFITRYIHSVQLTPVEDEYVIVGGRLWGWEERVQSHNAGLPFDAPANGRFIVDPPWMRIQGGRNSWESLIYRVGTDSIGKNEWIFPPRPPIKIYQRHPGKRVTITVKRLALVKALGQKKQGITAP